MSTFAALSKTIVAPPTVITIPPTVWAQTWEERPLTETRAGMRIVSDAEVQTAQHIARKFATEMHPGETERERELWVSAYHDALMRHVVARSLCDPQDAAKSYWPIRVAPEDMMASRDYVQPDGVRFLFDAYETLRITSDPTQKPLEDHQILDLFDAFEDRITALTPIKAGRVRRLLSYCLDELTA